MGQRLLQSGLKDGRESLPFHGEKVRDVWLVDDVSERSGVEILAAFRERIDSRRAVVTDPPREGSKTTRGIEWRRDAGAVSSGPSGRAS